jgi:hypothetical protein
MKLRRSNLIKNLLLSVITFALALSSLDFAHASAGYTIHGDASRGDVAIGAVNPADYVAADSLIEELDNSDNTGTKRRLPVAVANSISLKNPTNVDTTVSTLSCCPLTRPTRCPVEVKIVSWLEKEKNHLEHIKAQPLWLRLGVLLI